MARRAWIYCREFLFISHGRSSSDLNFNAWILICTRYHFYFHPDREQIYQLSQMAVSMTVDLGMDKPIRQAQTGFSASDVLPFLSHSRPSPGEIEAMRAYLGCYFLTSS